MDSYNYSNLPLQQADVANALGAVFCSMIFAAALAVFLVWLFHRIFSRAGYNGWLGLLALIPGFGVLICLCILAFDSWPKKFGRPEGIRCELPGQGVGTFIPDPVEFVPEAAAPRVPQPVAASATPPTADQYPPLSATTTTAPTVSVPAPVTPVVPFSAEPTGTQTFQEYQEAQAAAMPAESAPTVAPEVSAAAEATPDVPADSAPDTLGGSTH